MSAIKLFTATYLIGAGIFALALIVVVLAFAGVQTVGESIDLAWPIIGGFALMMISKFAAAAVLRKAEKTNG